MLNVLSLSVLALTLSSTLSRVVPRAPSPLDSSNWSDSLEDYDTYHSRYLDIGCQDRHSDAAFFDRCCHPLPGGQIPDTYCVSTNQDNESEDDDNCDDDVDSNSAPSPSPSYTSSSPYATPNDQARSANAGVVALASEANASNGGWGYQLGGFATFYWQGGNAGACGQWHGDYDLIAAIDVDRYGDTGRRSSECGKRVQITNTKNGKTVTVTIADACPTCKNGNSIDLSAGAFKQIATVQEGMVPIKWKYV